jgi:UDP-glucose 4-epimerase
LKYAFKDRRPGDITAAYADTSHANNVLGWKAKRDIGEALLSAWNWQKTLQP